MTDYKETLNLPSTSFPMKANLAKREPEILNEWQQGDIYAQIRKVSQHYPQFIIHDGPLYANGHLHCGHALNRILKDIILKAKTLLGFDAPFLPGWDCHGLPIELNVEKELSSCRMNVTATEFRAKCRLYATEQIAIQQQELQRIGIFGDWKHPYITMDPAYEANIIRAFGQIFINGYLQQGFKPVYWCLNCGSALAEAEVEYENKISPSIDVAFMVVDTHAIYKLFAQAFEASDTTVISASSSSSSTDGTLKSTDGTLKSTDGTLKSNATFELINKPVAVPIWTTTPWTLPANEAVCLHPKFEYALVETKTQYFVIAVDLVPSTCMRYQITDYTIKSKVRGQVLENIALKHPFYDIRVPIVLGEHVTLEAGTGCVHTAPAHGMEDYAVGLAYNLPLKNPVLPNGYYAADLPLFAGESILKITDKIIAILREHHCLLSQSKMQHSAPHCWRHKTAVIFLATPQWFIAMDANNLRNKVLALIDQVQWIPQWGNARIRKMIATRSDWCISRQRAWGVPLPLFIHKDTNTLHPKTIEFIEIIAKQVAIYGIEYWFDTDLHTFLGDDAADYIKLTDTLDVWFDAGVFHYNARQKQAVFPADLYIEGSDQHRGWFNSSLTTAAALYEQAPFKTVITHGYTVDADGHKLSKSRGNYIALDKIVNQYGADILRLWVSSTDYCQEVSISEEIIKRITDTYRRIRNTARFLLANLFDFDPEKHCLPATIKLVELDSWAIARAQQLQIEIIEAYENYNFHLIYQKVHNFCTLDMGSFYLDIIKDRQYTLATNSMARRSCQTAIFHIIHALTRWLAPILVFTAEEIWRAIPGKPKNTIFVEKWYTAWPMSYKIDMNFWQQLQNMRIEINKALEIKRQQAVIGSSLAAALSLYATTPTFLILQKFGEELRFLLIVSKVDIYPMQDCPADVVVNQELGLAIVVCASSDKKCIRCWHRCPDIGFTKEHPELCQRCVGNISGQDESRVLA